jgi:hypothetical protein
MKLLFALIFSNSRFWWGKLAAATLIGAVAFGWFALRSEHAEMHWLKFMEMGGAIGFLAALFLMAKDISEGVEIDDDTGTRTKVPPKYGSVLQLVAFLGILVVILVGLWILGDVMRQNRVA